MRWLDGITNAMEVKFGQTSGDGKGQGSLACCSVCVRRDWVTEKQQQKQLLKKKKKEAYLKG